MNEFVALNSDVTIVIDSGWRQRYTGRAQSDIQNAELITIDGLDAEFTGLVHLSSKAVTYIQDIKESGRQKEIGNTLLDLITTLEKWHNDGNLLLNYAQTDMQIQWLAPREDQFTLSPLLKRLDRYTQVKKDKIEAVIAYAYSTNDCKQKQILNYFGEKSKEKCKQCNASECLSPKHNVESIIREIIIEKLQINKMSLKDLDQSIAGIPAWINYQ